MGGIDPGIFSAAEGLWRQVLTFLQSMLLPWRLAQLGIIVGLFLIAHVFARFASHRLTHWLRGREGWPKWRLRLGILIEQRMRIILFAVLAWAVVLVMRQATWPSRSQIVALAAMISTAWVLIGLTTRLIGNRFVRRIVTWTAWIWATLYFLGFLDPASRFLDSVAITFGAFRLSALTVLKALAVTTLLFAGARFLSALVTGRLAQNEDISPSMRVLTAKLVQVVLFTMALVVGLKAVGFDLTGLAVFSGAVGVGLGFGLQKVVSNLVSGVIILLDKSIKPGDVISLGDTFGWIDSLGARYVSVVTRDGKEYLIPNEDLVTGQVVNWSHTNEFVRLDLKFGASYADDPHEVSKVAINAAVTVKRVLAHRKPVCWVIGFGDSSVDYVLRFWIKDAEAGLTNVRGQVYLALWDAFKENGFSIPFPQREIRVLNPSLAIAPATAPTAGTAVEAADASKFRMPKDDPPQDRDDA
ncbi:mechanosensitive ion channel family protein [Paracoccus pacificus]|uniref:Mechanosensitive ion channel family protein n=1 Tax=Paracoccus pacificus TaxID=1463598 RepID=A0ABW4R4F1_9RHOB